MAALVRNVLTRGLRLAVPARVANITLACNANALTASAPFRALHSHRVLSAVVTKFDVVSMRTHAFPWLHGYQHLPMVNKKLSLCLQSNNNSVRFYSDKEPLTKKLITDRVLLVLKLYDKIDATKVDQSAPRSLSGNPLIAPSSFAALD